MILCSHGTETPFPHQQTPGCPALGKQCWGNFITVDAYIKKIYIYTVSSLPTNLQVVNFQRSEHVFACPITKVSSRVWCTLSHVCILYVVVFLCTLLYSAIQSTVSLFQVQDYGSKHKNSVDVDGTTVLFKVLYCKIKNFLFFVCFYVLFV